MILCFAEEASGGADLKQTRPGAGIADAGDVGDVGDHMSANVGADVDVAGDVVADVVAAAAAAAAAADLRCNASVNASGGAAAGETILRCPWRPRGIVVVARQREADSGSGRWDMTAGADLRWGRGMRR